MISNICKFLNQSCAKKDNNQKLFYFWRQIQKKKNKFFGLENLNIVVKMQCTLPLSMETPKSVTTFG